MGSGRRKGDFFEIAKPHLVPNHDFQTNGSLGDLALDKESAPVLIESLHPFL